MSDWWSADQVADAPAKSNWWEADPIAEHAAPTINPMQRMTIDFQNQQRAAAQHTTPSISAHMPNLLSDTVEERDDGTAMFKDPQGSLVQFDPSAHVMLQDPTDAKLKVFSRSAETNEGLASSLGRFLMTGMGAGSMSLPARVPGAVGAAERIGVSLPRGIASESPLIRQSAQIVAKAPGGGPMHKAVESSIEDLGGAADRAVEMAGGSPEAEVAGQSVRSGFIDYFKPAIRKALDKLYGAVDSLVDPDMRHSLDKTSAAVADIAARRQAYGDTAVGKGVEMVMGAIQRPGGLTYDAIKNLRTRIGEMLDTGVFPEGTSENELRSIYGSLSDDLRSAVQRAGGPDAIAAFEKANAAKRFSAQWTDKLEKVLGPKTRSDEGVAGALYRMAQSGASADLETLKLARSAVPHSAWQDIASNVISRLGRTKSGEFSPALFIRDYGNLSEGGRRILFNGVGASDLVQFLNDISDVSKKFTQAGKLGNPSGTAGHGVGLGMIAAGGTGLAHGSWIEPIAAISTAFGTNVLARLLATPATAASMARWSRAYDVVVNKPGPAALASFDLATKNLAASTSGHVGVPAAEIEQRIRQSVQIGDEGENHQQQAEGAQ